MTDLEKLRIELAESEAEMFRLKHNGNGIAAMSLMPKVNILRRQIDEEQAKGKVSGQEIIQRHGLEARRILELIVNQGLRPWSQEGYQLFLDSPWANARERLHTVGAESFDPNTTDQALWLGKLARKALEWFYVESEVEALLKPSPATTAILKGMKAGEDDFNTVLTSYLSSLTPAGESGSGGLGVGPIDCKAPSSSSQKLTAGSKTKGRGRISKQLKAKKTDEELLQFRKHDARTWTLKKLANDFYPGDPANTLSAKMSWIKRALKRAREAKE